MKDELGGKIMKQFVELRAKTCSYLNDNNDEDKKGKGTKKYVIKRRLKFQDYKNCLKAAQIERKLNYLRKNKITVVDSLKLILKTQERFKSERHRVFIEKINNIALSSNDDKRM